jgi:hypothetical protein
MSSTCTFVQAFQSPISSLRHIEEKPKYVSKYQPRKPRDAVVPMMGNGRLNGNHATTQLP